MDLDQLVADREPENRHLAYRPPSVDSRRVVELLVGMANNEGGTVVVGVGTVEWGTPTVIQTVDCRDSLVVDVKEIAAARVERQLDVAVERFGVNGKQVVGFTTAPGDGLRSYRCDLVERPVFPVRRRTGLAYISGQDFSWYA